jgi:hypothetical protein
VYPALAEVVSPVPHQLDRLTDGLGDRRRLERRVGEQVTAERAAALCHVGGHVRDRETEYLGDGLLEIHRRLHRRPDLGAAGAHVGDCAVGLERVSGAEVEREALVERLAEAWRHR